MDMLLIYNRLVLNRNSVDNNEI